ncbi:hypothetical protein GDO86_018669, partial [Hymenochirus boettgeri]
HVTIIRTTTSSSNVPLPGSGPLDAAYAKSYSAILKVCLMLSLLIAFLCVRFSIWRYYSYSYSSFSYFEVVTISFMILIFIFYVINIFRIYRMLTCISWPLTELLHYAICTFLLFIASIIVAVNSYTIPALIAGSGLLYDYLSSYLSPK